MAISGKHCLRHHGHIVIDDENVFQVKGKCQLLNKQPGISHSPFSRAKFTARHCFWQLENGKQFSPRGSVSFELVTANDDNLYIFNNLSLLLHYVMVIQSALSRIFSVGRVKNPVRQSGSIANSFRPIKRFVSQSDALEIL